MTEIEQLQADLATIQNAAQIAKKQGFHERTGNYDQVEGDLKQKIADLEAQEQKVDEWKDVKMIAAYWLDHPRNPYVEGISLKRFAQCIQHLEAELAKRPVSDAAEELVKELEQYKAQAKTADAANHEHYGRLQDQLAIRDLKIEKLESQLAAEKQFAQRMIEHAQATCVERDKLIQEVKALKQKPETTETLEVCSVCNFPLSACDTPGVDGIPRMDCKMCQLKDQLQEAREQINDLAKPLDSNRVLETAAEIMFTLHISNKVLSTDFQNWLNRYFKFYKNKPIPYAWIVSRK